MCTFSYNFFLLLNVLSHLNQSPTRCIHISASCWSPNFSLHLIQLCRWNSTGSSFSCLHTLVVFHQIPYQVDKVTVPQFISAPFQDSKHLTEVMSNLCSLRDILFWGLPHSCSSTTGYFWCFWAAFALAHLHLSHSVIFSGVWLFSPPQHFLQDNCSQENANGSPTFHGICKIITICWNIFWQIHFNHFNWYICLSNTTIMMFSYKLDKG